MKRAISWLWPYPNLPLGASSLTPTENVFIPYPVLKSLWFFFSKRRLQKKMHSHFSAQQEQFSIHLAHLQSLTQLAYEAHFSSTQNADVDKEWRGLQWWQATVQTITRTLEALEKNDEQSLPFFFCFDRASERECLHLQLSDLDILLSFDSEKKQFWLLCDRKKNLEGGHTDHFRQSFGHFSREMLDQWIHLLGPIHRHFHQQTGLRNREVSPSQ
jgi:hypothetical protein